MSEITYLQNKIEEIDEIEDTVINTFDCGYGFMVVQVIWDEDADFIEELEEDTHD